MPQVPPTGLPPLQPLAEAARAVIDRPAANDPARPHVLVVDDIDANRDTLSRRLNRQGFRASTAADGPAALEFVARNAVDLVLLDVMMPGMSGFDVLERLRRDYPAARLPVIMQTAKGDGSDIVQALSLGANDYVTKPLDFSVVVARVQTHLALKRAVDEIAGLEGELTRRNSELESINGRLIEAAARTHHELAMAARVQETFLPPPRFRVPGAAFAWAFRPCTELAGDALNICALPTGHVGMYLLDVAGHGVAASLLAVAATRALSAVGDGDSMLMRPHAPGELNVPVAPAEVAARLSRRFEWNEITNQYLTLAYALLDPRDGTLTYTSAGHPPAVLHPVDGPPRFLTGSGLPISLGVDYGESTLNLRTGDRVYFYSDGVTETRNAQGEFFGRDNLFRVLANQDRSADLQQAVDGMIAELDAFRGTSTAPDDISLLAVERERGIS